MTLGQAYDPRSNGITGLRLGLALTVVFAHSFKLGGFGPDPGEYATNGQMQLGYLSVTAFFVLSGFLLAGSRERGSPVMFLRNRFLRVFPGFWVCLAVTAVILAPIGAFLGGTPYAIGDGAKYLIGNASLLMFEPFIGKVYSNNPYSLVVNGSLWTLAPEFTCYLVLAIIPSRFLRVLAPGLVTALVILHVARQIGLVPSAIALDLPLAFGLGVVAYQLRDHIPFGPIAGLVALASIVIVSAAGLLVALAPFGLAYMTLWAAIRLPFRPRHDLSYGVYVYAFGLQQVFAAAGMHTFGLLPYLALSVGSSLVAGWLSWTFVERPAMSLKGRGRPAPPASDPDAGSQKLWAAESAARLDPVPKEAG